jgi:hypothetical protein
MENILARHHSGTSGGVAGSFPFPKRAGQHVFPHLDRAALMERFRQLSRHSMKIGTRTLDIMHVACACEIQAHTFLSFDERQCALTQLAWQKVLKPIAD